jgi:hypothetical protein
MKKFFLAFCFILVSACAAAQTNYVKNLHELEKLQGQELLFTTLAKGEPLLRYPAVDAQQEIQETLDYLKQKGFTENNSSQFTYSYAVWLYKVGVHDLSSAMFLFATIKARSDGARCSDKTSAPKVTKDYEQYLTSELSPLTAKLPASEREKIYKIATINLEDRLTKQSPDEWLCGNGIDYFYKHVEKYQDQKDKTIVKDYSIKPDFIEQTQWLKSRKETTDKAVKSARVFLFGVEK